MCGLGDLFVGGGLTGFSAGLSISSIVRMIWDWRKKILPVVVGQHRMDSSSRWSSE
jgi:hypothetical protein